MATVLRMTERSPDRLDRIDRRILVELQRNATMPIAQIAEKVGLSQTPCWKRIQKLEASGVITGRVALLDPARIGLPLIVFVEIEASHHTPAWREGFTRVVAAMPEVLEVYRMAGDVDYLLKVVASDAAAFDEFYNRLTATLELRNVTSQFSMERVKHTTELPVAIND